MEAIILQSATSEFRLSDIPVELVSQLLNSVIDTEIGLIDNILQQILKKKPDEEDYKNLARIYHYKDPLNYDLFFRGVNIGCVYFNFEYPSEHYAPENRLVIRFIPIGHALHLVLRH